MGTRPPRDHPAAWKSPLWEHVDFIRSLRRARKSWPEVAKHLEERGVKVTWRTVQRFFSRATKPKKGKLPLGFSISDSSPESPKPQPSTRVVPPSAGVDIYSPGILDPEPRNVLKPPWEPTP